MDNRRFEELDVLRGLAALGVVIFHYSGHATRYFHDFPFQFRLGEHGVQLFFCISGFVIFWTLRRSKSIGDFAISRCTRLYPSYWASLVVSAALSVFLLSRPIWLTGYIVNATMLQSFIGGLVGVGNLDVVYWTLGVELLFYFWMGMLFITGNLHRFVTFSWAWLGMAIAMTSVKENTAFSWVIDYLMLRNIAYFLAGSIFYLISTDGPRVKYLAPIALAWAVCGLWDGLEGLATAAIVFGLFCLAIGGKLRWSVNDATIWLGSISYALYLTHRFAGYELLFVLHAAGVPSTFAVVFVLICAIALASVITIGIERPAMAFVRRHVRSNASR